MYTVEADEVVDLYPASGSSVLPYGESARTIHIYGTGSNDDTIETSTGLFTDDLFLYYNSTTLDVEAYYWAPDNKARYFRNVENGNTANLGYFKFQDTRMPIVSRHDQCLIIQQ